MVSTKVVVYLIAILLVFSYGITGSYILGKSGQLLGFNPKTDGIVSAVYFTVETVSTVGYGDIEPITNTAKIFVIILIIGGLSVVFTGLATLGGDFLTNRIENLYGRISKGESKLFKNHVVLIGTNSTNLYLAQKMGEGKERFIMVTSDKIKADQLRYHHNYLTYVADATSESDMERFNLDQAKAIVIDVKDSSRTIYVLLVAKSIVKNATKIVAVAPSEEAERHIRSLNVASSIINPSYIAASQISDKLFKK